MDKNVKLSGILSQFLCSPQSSSSPSSNKTSLGSSACITTNGRRMTDMLMVTTTVRMLDRVHRYTTDLWPAVPLDLVFVVGTTSLQEGLVDTTTASNDTYCGTGFRVDNLL